MNLSLSQIMAKLPERNIEKIIERHNTKYKGVRFRIYDEYLQVAKEDYNCFIRALNGDYIKLKNIHINEAIEMIMDIFDTYNEWENKVRAACIKLDFNEIVNVSWDIFNNPMIINDTNMRNLAISRNVDVTAINNEYYHLATYGFTSLAAYKRFADIYEKQVSNPSTRPLYLENPVGNPNPNMLCGLVRKDNETFGRFLIVQYYRNFIESDYQNLEFICQLISRYISNENSTYIENYSIINNFINMLHGINITVDDIDNYYTYLEWDEDSTLRVIIIKHEKEKQGKTMLLLLNSYMKDVFPNFPCFVVDGYIVILANESMLKFHEILDKIINSYAYKRGASFGISLKFRGLTRVKEFYTQSKFALNRANNLFNDGMDRIYMFMDCAVDYIILAETPTQKLCACMPEIKYIFAQKDKDTKDLFITLKSYLSNGSSIAKSSEELKVHKNTVSYRISKFATRLTFDINNPYIKEYLLISIRIIDNYKDLITGDKYNKY